jgi:hypothetical protein
LAIGGRRRIAIARCGRPSPAHSGEWRLLNAHIYEPERLTHQQWIFGSDLFCRVPQQNKGKRLGFAAVWSCRARNASWGYSRRWLGHRLASAKTVLGLIENVLSLVLSWHCLRTLGPTRCPSHSGRLCQTRTQPSRSGPEAVGLFPAEHGGHGRPFARLESRAGVR